MSEHAVLHRDNSEQETEERTWDVTGKIVILDDHRLPPKSSATGVGSEVGRSMPTRPSVSFQAPPDPDLHRAYWIAAAAFSPVVVQQWVRTVETIGQAFASPSFVNQTSASMQAIQQAMANMASIPIPDANMLARQMRETVSASTYLQAAAQRAASAMMQPIDPSPTQRISGGDADRPIHDAGMRSTDERISMQVAPVTPTLERIRSFAELDQDWTGELAKRVSAAAVAEADLLLVYSLETGVYGSGVAVDAVPTPAGGLLIEWLGTRRRLQIHVHEDGHLTGLLAEMENGRSTLRKGIGTVSLQEIMETLGAVE